MGAPSGPRPPGPPTRWQRRWTALLFPPSVVHNKNVGPFLPCCHASLGLSINRSINALSVLDPLPLASFPSSSLFQFLFHRPCPVLLSRYVLVVSPVSFCFTPPSTPPLECGKPIAPPPFF